MLSRSPHIPVFDKSASYGTFERADFVYDLDDDHYTCPAGKVLRRCRSDGRRDPDAPEGGLEASSSLSV